MEPNKEYELMRVPAERNEPTLSSQTLAQTNSDLDGSKGLEKDQEFESQSDIEPVEEIKDASGDVADNGESGPPPERTRTRTTIVLIMSALCMAVFLAALDVTIITTAAPTIAEHFHSSAGYTWIGSAYLLGNSASTPLWGKVSDIFGRKPVLLAANAVFCIGSLIAALSVNIGMLLAARAIQGIGGGGLVTLVNITISDLFSQRKRPVYFGIIGGVWAVASALGPVVGGVFTEKVSWRWCFYINLPLDGAAFLIIFFFLDVHTPKTPLWAGIKAIDWIGTLTIVGGTVMLLMGLEFGGVTHPWTSAVVLCLILFGVATIILFLLNEWKLATYPMMPLRLFRARTSVAALGTVFIHGMVFIAGSYFLPLYFQAVRGATPLLSGVYVLPTALSLSCISAATGFYIRKSGRYRDPIWFGMTLMLLGYGLFIDIDAKSSWTKLILYQVVAGIGIGPNFQAPLIAFQASVSTRDIATATATFGFIRQLATSISVVIGGVVFQNRMQTRSPALLAALGETTARALGGGNAGANVRLVAALPEAQRRIARQAYAGSLSEMWIMYTTLAAVGVLFSLAIGTKELRKEHVETRTGLEEEKRARVERLEEKLRQRSGGKEVDV